MAKDKKGNQFSKNKEKENPYPLQNKEKRIPRA